VVANHVYVIKVPKPDPKSYNPNRSITGLVQNQLFHLSVAERHLPEHHRSGIDPYSIDSEGKAAEYIRRLTAKLHPEGAKTPRASKRSKARRQVREQREVKPSRKS
jgi:hypothetical protein